MKRARRIAPETRAVEIQAKVDQLIRLDRAEDQLLARAATEAHEAELHAESALELIAAAKRVDALEDQVISELRRDTFDVAGDITAMTSEIFATTRERAAQPKAIDVGEARA